MIRGCLLFQKNGLGQPHVVTQARDEYHRDEDLISDFVDDCCYIDPEAWIGATQAYIAFEVWWKRNVNNKPPKQKKFGTMFKKRFNRIKKSSYIYTGVGIRDERDNPG